MEALDARSLKRLVVMLEKRMHANSELRIKHADQPDRFLESEVELDEAIKRLAVVAAAPELYPDLVQAGGVAALTTLLTHENLDLVADVLDLLAELLDADIAEENREHAAALVRAFAAGGGLEALVARLPALDERAREDRDGEGSGAVAGALNLLETMADLSKEVAEGVFERTPLLRWLLARLKGKAFDPVKGAAGELLAALVQGSTPNQKALGLEEGVDALLQCIAPYRNRDPEEGAAGDEEGFLDSLFDALCSALLVPGNRLSFVDCEGVELMIMVLKTKRFAGLGALRCLDFATTKCRPACERVVDGGGLKSLFACFMDKGKIKRRKDEEDQDTVIAERSLSAVFNLLQNLPPGPQFDRVCAKFVESEFEKCDRLVEIIFDIRERLLEAEARIEGVFEELAEAVDPEELLLARLEAGLFPLQQACLILGHVWATRDAGVRKRLVMLLHMRSQSLAAVREVLLEYYAAIGDVEGAEERGRERAKVRGLLLSLGTEETELVAAEANWAENDTAAAAAGSGAGGRKRSRSRERDGEQAPKRR